MVTFTTYDCYEVVSILNNRGEIFSRNNVKVTKYGSAVSAYGEYNIRNDERVSIGNNVYRIPLFENNNGANIKWIAYE